ncbi:MAG: thioesterase family protein [Solirubrobacteraceae bacterium]|nr:thioesterase family protein [Solirubrobacteraceae bacterium]
MADRPVDRPAEPTPAASADHPALADQTAFQRTTAVTALGGGRYACAFDHGWSTAAGINGGILMATMVRALQAEIAADRHPRSLQVQFMRPPAAGPAEIQIELIRQGARATNARVRVTQGDKLMVEGLATSFSNDLDVIAEWAPHPPQVPEPGEMPPRLVDPRMPPVGDHLAYRPAIGPFPFTGEALVPGEPARTGGWLELRESSPVDLALVAFYIDAWWPAALGPITEMSMNPTVELSLHFRTALPPEGLPHQPLLLDVRTDASLQGLADEHARLFTADGTLLADAVQLAITRRAPQQP